MRSCLKGQLCALSLSRPVSGVWTNLGDPVLRHAAGRCRAGGKSQPLLNGLGLGFANYHSSEGNPLVFRDRPLLVGCFLAF